MEITCSFSARKHVFDTMKKFFLCTHIPIRALSNEGDFIHTIGYNKRFEALFENQKVIEKTEEKLCKEDSRSSLTLSSGSICFTVIYICPRNVHRGIYIIGPYKTCPSKDIEILYKPDSCIPHLISLLRNIAEDSAFIRRKKQAPYSLYVKKALDYMDARYNTPLSVEHISNYLGISKYYFCTMFKRETGKTFTQLLNEIRVEKSKYLLLEGKQSILDTAIAVGYNNQNYYNMIFKRITKTTPLEFRKCQL